MKPRVEHNSFAVPPSLVAEIEAAADEESVLSRTCSARPSSVTSKPALAADLAYGEERARALGLERGHIPRLNSRVPGRATVRPLR